MRLAFDLHLHSCLSPCGDSEMTPGNLAGMCALAGLDVVALTDHNSSGNCAAFSQAAAKYGLLTIPGMELCTKEEVHVVCLFPELEQADAFSAHVRTRLPAIANNRELFGPQVLMDSEDRILGEETCLLAGATDICLYDVPDLVESFGGIAYPAHIDRHSNSLLSQMGIWDPDMRFALAEVSLNCPETLFRRRDLQDLRFVHASDAHYLHQIPDAYQHMEIPKKTAEMAIKWLVNG